MLSRVKRQIIEEVAGSLPHSSKGASVEKIGPYFVHCKGVSSPSRKQIYPFNINPTVLENDFEIWVCGLDGNYYLIPIDKLKWMNNHPKARPDRSNPGYTIVDVDLSSHTVTVGRGVELDLTPYYQVTLDSPSRLFGSLAGIGEGEGSTEEFGSGPESDAHLRLKQHVAQDPEEVTGEEGIEWIATEFSFPTGDRADVVLSDSRGNIMGVEIEVVVGPNDIDGPLQAIKYRNMLEPLFRVDSGSSRAILVAHSIDVEMKNICDTYDG